MVITEKAITNNHGIQSAHTNTGVIFEIECNSKDGDRSGYGYYGSFVRNLKDLPDIETVAVSTKNDAILQLNKMKIESIDFLVPAQSV